DAEVAAELVNGGPGRVEVDRSEPLNVDFATFAVAIIAYGDARDDVVVAHVGVANTMINVVDRPELSRFIFPAIVDRRDVVIAIGTGGASPVLARRLRERIEALLPSRVGDLAALMSRYRKPFAAARHASRSLRRFWERVIDGPIGAAALSG